MRKIWINLVVLIVLVVSPLAGRGSQGAVALLADTYSISGRVTDGSGNPIQGVSVTAVFQGISVYVKDESNNPIAGAQVHKNGILAGVTGADGILTLSNLVVGDELIAQKLIIEKETQKANHNQDSSQNWGYRVYITSLDIPKDGEPTPFTVSNLQVTQELIIKKSNTRIGFNLLVAIEWDANSEYLDDLQQGLLNASQYLYDATNGQMNFERVTIYDNNQYMGDADYQIRASNQEWPRANVNGLLSDGNLHIFLGRFFDGSSANQGEWSAENGFRTQIHEFCHYGLSLYDSYFYYDGLIKKDGHCISVDIRTNSTESTNATLMDFQYNATEFSMKDVSQLWSVDCLQTDQYIRTGKSDWEAIITLFKDSNDPSRWELKSPAIYSGVVSGPTFFPVDGWTVINVGNNANTGVCEPPVIYRATHLWGAPAAGASVVLRKNDLDIQQGKTDDDGLITVLGAASGDRVIFNLFGIDLRINSTVVSCSSSWSPQMLVSAPTEIQLIPAFYQLSIEVEPGLSANQIKIIVKATTELSSSPITMVTQHGDSSLTSVALSYDAGNGAYIGEIVLDPSLPLSGTIVSLATDNFDRAVDVSVGFSLEEIDPVQAMIIWSGDGQAEVYFPAGSLSSSGQININLSTQTEVLPEHKVVLSGPYTLSASPDVELTAIANLALYYLDLGGSLNHAKLASAQIYRLVEGSWLPLESQISQSESVVSAQITQLGTYVLLANWEAKTYLPFLTKDFSYSDKSLDFNNDTNESSNIVTGSHLAKDGESTQIANLTSVTFTAITGPDGNYSITGLPAGSYVISSTQSGYSFTPTSRQVIIPPDATGVDFTRVDNVPGEMISIPAGSFSMGCDPAHNGGDSCYSSELPLHTVYLDAYRIDKTEVTNA